MFLTLCHNSSTSFLLWRVCSFRDLLIVKGSRFCRSLPGFFRGLTFFVLVLGLVDETTLLTVMVEEIVIADD